MLQMASSYYVITPKSPTYMEGYFGRVEQSLGKYDDLRGKTLLLSIDGEIILFVVLDIIAVSKKYVATLKQILHGKFKINPCNIIISATHTHSGPAMFPIVVEGIEYDQEYEKTVMNCITTSVEYCLKTLEKVSAYFAQGTIIGYYGNRNVHHGETDQEVSILEFRKADGNIMDCIVNLSCHPTILGSDNLYYSADIIGAVRSGLEKEWKVCPVIINGDCGDSSTRFYRQGHDYKEVIRVGYGIAKEILKIETRELLSVDHLSVKYVSTSVHYSPQQDNYLSNTIQKMEYELKNAQEEKHFFSMEQLLNILHKRKSKKVIAYTLNSYIYTLGDIRIVTIPGELTAKLGRRIKEKSNKKCTIISCYTNDYRSYLVSSDDYGKYFETFISENPFGKADEFVDRIIHNFI